MSNLADVALAWNLINLILIKPHLIIQIKSRSRVKTHLSRYIYYFLFECEFPTELPSLSFIMNHITFCKSQLTRPSPSFCFDKSIIVDRLNFFILAYRETKLARFFSRLQSSKPCHVKIGNNNRDDIATRHFAI